MRRFVSEQITPLRESLDGERMAHGEPGLPGAFVWRGNRYDVAAQLSAWKETAHDRGEQYVRKHWFELRTDAGMLMRIYFERQRRRGAAAGSPRWWLHTVDEPDTPAAPSVPPA